MSITSLFRAARPLVMGIVNVTPDSFSDGGRYLDAARALAHARALIDEGADLLDIGGESSRPGAEPVATEEELRRVLPLVEKLAAVVPVSVDTVKPAVADAALRAGARIINDIAGLRDAGLLRVCVAHQAAVVIMHMRGTPRTMQQAPFYADVVREVRDYLAARLRAARAAGLADIAVDPGFGFGKTAAHNWELLRRLDELAELDAPLLAGMSRKSFLGALEPALAADQRLEVSLAAAVIAAMKGASVLRVHDVAACRRALRVVEAVQAA